MTLYLMGHLLTKKILLSFWGILAFSLPFLSFCSPAAKRNVLLGTEEKDLCFV